MNLSVNRKLHFLERLYSTLYHWTLKHCIRLIYLSLVLFSLLVFIVSCPFLGDIKSLWDNLANELKLCKIHNCVCTFIVFLCSQIKTYISKGFRIFLQTYNLFNNGAYDIIHAHLSRIIPKRPKFEYSNDIMPSNLTNIEM